jgi:hypothetical protein
VAAALACGAPLLVLLLTPLLRPLLPRLLLI